MAGLDGIQNKIHPGDAMDKNLYDLPPAELDEGSDRLRFAARSTGSLTKPIMTSCSKGDVFTKDQIEAYIELKWEEVSRWETTPSPVEFDMYYSG